MDKIYKILLILMGLVLTIGFIDVASAQTESTPIDLGQVPLNSSLNLLLDCSYNNTDCAISALCNITVQYPNRSLMINNLQMGTAFYPKFNRTIPNTLVFGVHTGKQTCCQSGFCGQQNFFYEITPSGNEVAGGNFLIFLYLLFGVILVLMLYTLVMTVVKVVTVSETIYGVLFTWCVYLSLLVLSWLTSNYSTSGFLRSNVDLFSTIARFTHIVLPLLSFIISMFARSMEKKRPLKVQEITGRSFVGYG